MLHIWVFSLGFPLLSLPLSRNARLHGHAIFGIVSVSDTCRTPERVRRAGFRCPAVSLFFFFFFPILRHGADTAPTRLRRGSDTAPTRLRRVRHASSEKKKKREEKTQILTGGLTYSVDFVITLKH